MKKIFICYSAGCLGGLANSLLVWFFGEQGITQQFGVAITPHLTLDWLYPRIVWGGVWGLLFVLPLLSSKPFKQGSVLSLVPTAVQLFIIFPFIAYKGMGGLDLGLLTPLFILFFNWIWGVVTAVAIKQAK